MKTSTTLYFKVFITCIILSAILMLSFTFTVRLNTKVAEKPQENVPYFSSEAPEYFGILIRFSEADSVYFGFNRLDKKTTVIMLPNGAGEKNVLEYGYTVNAVSNASFDFLARLIDNFGGVELNTGSDGVFRYTGVQITEMLSKTTDIVFKKTVIQRVLKSMQEKSVQRGDLILLLEQTETGLNYPDIYYLHETINSAVREIMFAN